MFCPKCAAKNLDGASFCRVCGANISLVSNALSGQAPQQPSDESLDIGRGRRRRGRGEPGLDHAVRSLFMGIGFLCVCMALAFSNFGRGWWFWMLIPAFSMMGTGVAQYIRLKEREKRALQQANSFQSPSFQPQRYPAEELPPRNTGELVPPPPSVTEGTTRHLGAEAPTRHLDE